MVNDDDITRLIESGFKFERMQKRSGQKVRKHEWLPCLLSAKLDEMTDEEKEQLPKATKWLDKLTGAEYSLMFSPDGMSKSYTYAVRSRLKAKVRDWLMCISTLSTFEPEILTDALLEAKEKYEEQTGRKFFLDRLSLGGLDHWSWSQISKVLLELQAKQE